MFRGAKEIVKPSPNPLDIARRAASWLVLALLVGVAVYLAGRPWTALREPSPPPPSPPAAERAPTVESPSGQAPPRDRAPRPRFRRLLPPMLEPWTGDLPGMRQRRRVRVLVSYSRTNFFIRDGEPLGFEAELMRLYEDFLNRDASPFEPRVEVVFVPTTLERLIPSLVTGRGDIAAAGLTVTPDRRRRVAFTEPYLPDVAEVVVVHRGVEDLHRLADLAGRSVHVVRGSSYVRHLELLADALRAAGRPGLDIVEMDEHLELDDVLELVNAGVVELTVADHHIAELWAQVLPDVEVRSELEISSGGRLAWAVRKSSERLRASLDRFIRRHRKGTFLGNVLFRRYYGSTGWIRNPASRDARRRLARYRPLFEELGERHHLDPLVLAAIAFQESGLDPGEVSHAGAIGLMQVRPGTAGAVGVGDVTDVRANVAAAARYLARLRDRFFADPDLDPEVRLHFVLAAYNAGPTRIQRLRRRAAVMGFDPDRWFDHVELAALRHRGHETVGYVSSVYKYYVAYRLLDEGLDRKARELERLHGDGVES